MDGLGALSSQISILIQPLRTPLLKVVSFLDSNGGADWDHEIWKWDLCSGDGIYGICSGDGIHAVGVGFMQIN